MKTDYESAEIIDDSSDEEYVIMPKIKQKKTKKPINLLKVCYNLDETILEIGVDGVIFEASSISEVKEAMVYLGTSTFELSKAQIIDIKEVGDGERVCVDTASMLHKGEGMLIGSRSNFLFLVHNESVGSSFTSPRPFRVNAGAVHCYTVSPDGTTKFCVPTVVNV